MHSLPPPPQVLPPAITELQLSHTLLRGTIPANWALPVNLTTLDLSSNLLSGVSRLGRIDSVEGGACNEQQCSV